MKSPLIFRVFKNEQIHVVKQFLDKEQVLFGHEAEVDVDLDSADVSPIHCLIEKRGNQYFICDLGSTQGTFKNGQMILDEAIASGDEFTVGPFRIIFFIGAPKPVHSPKTGSEVVIQPAPVVLAAAAPTSTASSSASASTGAKEVVQPAAQSKPQIQSVVVGSKVSPRGQQFLKSRNKKGRKTFAPENQIQDLRDYVKPGKGQLVEVIVAWKERILTTYHFAPVGMKKLGREQDIQIPDGASPKNWTFLDCTNGVQIRATNDMKVEVQNSMELRTITDSAYRLQQNETVFVTLSNSMQLIVRFAPMAPAIPFESAAILSSSELTGVLAALIVAALTSLIVSVTAPKAIEKEEEIERVAQVIFDKPPVPIAKLPTPPEPQKPPEPVTPPKPPEPKKPPEQPKKITEAELQKQAQAKGDPKKPDQVAQQAQKAGRASEVKPKDPKFKQKQFTSTKQGGAVKTGTQAGANAKSKEPDPTNAGLLSAFGSGGVRSKLDQAYSGTGQALGTGEKATGASGFNENRAGDDVGSKFKDTGAGGKGTATQGIAGIGTGKGLGMSATGTGTGFGSKDQVAIQPGGAEEEFVGSIDREAVRRAVRSALPFFKACYDREYNKNSKLSGKLVISWEIHEKGIARNAKVVKEKSTIGNSAVEECVRKRMLEVVFPEPPGGTIAEVTYPFLFQGQK